MDINNFQRIGPISNADVDRRFEVLAQEYFRRWEKIELELNYPVGVSASQAKEKKHRHFDLGSDDPPVLVECKSHRSQQSLLYPDANYQADPMAPAFASRWEHLMENVDLWLHGHTHLGVDYRVGDCRVVSNPRGYPGEDVGFDPRLTIEVPTSSNELPAVPERAPEWVQTDEAD